MENIISNWTGDNYYLSNYYPCKVTFNGITYDSAEAAYHAQKSIGHQKDFIGMSADDSKHYSRILPLRQDWDLVKVDIMKQIVFNKFNQHRSLKKKLLQTNDSYLQEEGWWGDTYWGVYNGQGENVLGKIIMEVREMFRNK